MIRSGNRLEVVGVQSSDNAPDAPSRDKDLDHSTCDRCALVIENWKTGSGRSCRRVVEQPAFDGELRHKDSDDGITAAEELLNDISLAEVEDETQ